MLVMTADRRWRGVPMYGVAPPVVARSRPDPGFQAPSGDTPQAWCNRAPTPPRLDRDHRHRCCSRPVDSVMPIPSPDSFDSNSESDFDADATGASPRPVPAPTGGLPAPLAAERSRVLDRWLGHPSGLLWVMTDSLRPLHEIGREAQGVGIRMRGDPPQPETWATVAAHVRAAEHRATGAALPTATPSAFVLAVPPAPGDTLPTDLWVALTNRMTLGQTDATTRGICWLAPGGLDRLPSDWIRRGCIWTPSPDWLRLAPAR